MFRPTLMSSAAPVVMLAWSDLGRAREFLVSEDLRDMLGEIGACDRAPDVYLLEEVEETRAATCRAVTRDQPDDRDLPGASP